MNISKQSWHYKLTANIFTFPSHDFCNYIRQLLLSLSLIILLICIVGLCLPTAIGFIFYDITSLILEDNSLFGLTSIYSIVPVFIITGYIVGSIIILLLYFCLDILPTHIKKKYQEYKQSKFEDEYFNKDVPPKEPNVFIEWYKHKKGKYCSKITFTANKEDA